MKKTYFVMLMLLVGISGFSQKVKINKNTISVDNVAVGKIEKYKNEGTKQIDYTYSDMKGENKFTMVKYYFDPENIFFVVKPNFSTDTAEIKLQYLSFTLSEQNGLTDLLVKKYHFFDKDGMNMNVINDYLSAKHEPQIPLVIQRIKERGQAAQMQKQTEEEQKQAVRAMHIHVYKNGEITKDSYTVMGRFIAAPNPAASISPDNRIVINDNSGNAIAAVTSGGEAKDSFTATILTYDKNTFKVRASYSKDDPTRFYEKVAEFLALKEYLEGQSNSYAVKKAEFDKKKAEYDKMQNDKAEANEAARKEKTEVQGILTFKDGTKISGTFRFEYRQTPEGKIASEGSISDFDTGKIIYHLYQDEKGKNKIKIYNVKNVSSFYINDKEVYEAVTYKKGDRLKDAMSGGSLDLGKMLGGSKTQKFLLRLAVTDKARLYFYGGEYILMKPGSEDAIVGKTLNTADLVKFTSDCPVISQKIANNDYTNGGDSYKQLVEDYTKCD